MLATGGSGDLLTGIAVTLLAQMAEPASAAACAAWVHGRAAELVQFGGRNGDGVEAPFSADLDEPLDDGRDRSGARTGAPTVPARRDARGFVLDDVVAALPDVWRLSRAVPRPPVLVELPAVEGRS